MHSATVEHTVVKNTTIECKDRTKTENSRRSFSLFPDVREGLEMLKMRQKTERAERITSGATYLESDYLFRHPDGRLFRPDYVTRAFERVARAEISPTFRFHDLRHATASILFERGWSVKDVQEWLGHADVETTLNIYVHYTRARKILLGNDFRPRCGFAPTFPDRALERELHHAWHELRRRFLCSASRPHPPEEFCLAILRML